MSDVSAEPFKSETPSNEDENRQRAMAAPRPVEGARSAMAPAKGAVQPTGEHGGPKGPEPTRYGDWEKGGRCFDF